MCGCDRATLEQYFGYQVQDSGFLRRYAAAGSIIGRANYTPTNPLGFPGEPGFTGVRYALDARATAPLFAERRYGGILPLAEQPRAELPQPYDRRVVI